MKKCPKCREEKDELEFYTDPTSRDGLGCWCKECQKESHRIKAANIKDYNKNRVLRKNYNSSLPEFNKILKNQGGVCAICGELKEKMCLDHNHETDEIRGILCVTCNSGLGQFYDNPDYLTSAAGYLRKGPVARDVGSLLHSL